MADDAKTPASGKATAAEPAVKTARGTVAKGRTILAPTDERRIVGYGQDGNPVYRAVDKHFGPGQEVTLPETEIAHLRGAGFLVDPNAEAPQYVDGQTYQRA